MIEWSEIVTAARRELEVAGEGEDWIAARLPGGGRVVKLRRRDAHAQPWVQVLVAVGPARRAHWTRILRASGRLVLGAPAIDEDTLVLREALSLRSATWPGIRQLCAALEPAADMIARLCTTPAEATALATPFAE